MKKIDQKILLGNLICISSLFTLATPASAILLPNSTLSNTTVTQTTTSVLSNPTTTIENTTQTTTTTSLTDTLNTSLQETTNTTVGTIAGASTDSQTTATVVNPTEIDSALTSTLSNPENLIEPNGQLNGTVMVNDEGVKLETNADLNVTVGSLADVNICLDGSASIGSPDNGSLANCSEQPRQVPEPAFIGGLFMLGGYLITHKKKSLCIANSPKI
ncbi:MAG: hypothetical protein EAZ76_04805 [Nostocales cyanobacterium]|nr:MAG: hypothetical protein EAZ87_01335 [Nostocales cyanobacterium]TAF18532.1 MAG: hypothetical protein EAZ76_04805 [Nostocales cyanobacterium]